MRLSLFFTKGISLKDWQETGNLDREVKPYRKLAKHFEKIYFFTYGNREDLEFQGILPDNIIICPKKWNLPSLVYSFLLPFFYAKHLKRVNLLKTNQMQGAWTAVLAKILFGKKLIVRCGYEWLRTMQRERKPRRKLWLAAFLEQIAYKQADKIILTSSGDKSFVEKRFNIPGSKIEIIPNYIDTELFKPSWQPKEENRIIFVGRLSPEKNLFNLIKAISSFSAHLVLIGKGPLRQKLEEFAQEQGANVEFTGVIPNNKLPQELNSSAIFILPSFYEGCPKVLLEAMACGLVCIAADVEGIREIIRHRENGFLCQTDSDSIKKAIVEVLADKALQEKIAQNGRQTILQNFSLPKILQKELAVLRGSTSKH